MYCRNCGQKLADGDKFCSACGTKAPIEENQIENIAVAAPAVENEGTVTTEDKPLFEPFDFKAFGFDFADLGLGTGVKKDTAAGETKPTPPTEKFDWNTGAFPDTSANTKTEDINFNWSLTQEEKAAEPKAETFAPAEPEWTEPAPAAEPASALEEELFGNIESKANETRKQSEEIDKFFTFHKKNEEFQKILDREYEKVKSGNILTEEMNAAEAVSEEKFVARQPEDPMEELFAAEGVIKGYEPKPVETDVLERIEAAEAEKKIREEAAKIAEAKLAEMNAAETAIAPAEEEAAAVEAAEAESDTVQEDVSETIEAQEEETETVTEEMPAEEPAAAETEAVEEETAEAVDTVEELQVVDVIEDETSEDIPEKTKQVDKAAILAEMAVASEMVQRDRAYAAAQAVETVETADVPAEAPAEEIKIEVPDFLGHQEEEEAVEVSPEVEEIETETEETAAETEEAAEEPAVEISVEEVMAEAEEQHEAEETPAAPSLEFDIFEQLAAQEEPVEEIVVKEPQTIEDLFAEIPTVESFEEETVTAHTVVLTEDSVAEILKTVEEDTTKDDTMVFTAHALGALLAEAEQTDPDASEVVVSLEELTALEQQAAEGTLPPVGVAEEEAEEEEIQGGKGRTFLKICLVVLVILLVIEVAGVAIKIAAPTSGAANFIDNQLEKVFQLIGEEDTNPDEFNA